MIVRDIICVSEYSIASGTSAQRILKRIQNRCELLKCVNYDDLG